MLVEVLNPVHLKYVSRINDLVEGHVTNPTRDGGPDRPQTAGTIGKTMLYASVSLSDWRCRAPSARRVVCESGVGEDAGDDVMLIHIRDRAFDETSRADLQGSSGALAQ